MRKPPSFAALRRSASNTNHTSNTRQLDADHGRHSIFGEILDWMLAPLLVLWPLSIAITWLVAKSIANQPFDQALEQHLLRLSQQIEWADGAYRLPASALRAQSLADEYDLRYLQFVDSQSQIIVGDSQLPLPNSNEDEPNTQVQFRQARYADSELRIAYRWQLLPARASQPAHYALLQVGETLHKRAKLANEMIRGVILPQFVILPLILFLVWFALARGLSPIAALQTRIRQRQPDDVSPITSQHLPEEIAPLVDSLNDMLARLEMAIAQQKRFIADAAHQMKTPLAGMRMQVELALRDAEQNNLLEVQRSLQQLAKSSGNATHLVNQLLSLARAENQTPQTRAPDLKHPEGVGTLNKWDRLDLHALAQELLQDWAMPALARNIDLGFESFLCDEKGQFRTCNEAAWIHGHTILMRELINNLLDNALLYSAQPEIGEHACNGIVTLRIIKIPNPDGATQVVLELEDNGPGIAIEEREHVFQRFYRILGNQASGSGLGLAIVREIAQQHGASISVSDNPACAKLPRHGCVFRVVFAALTVPNEVSTRHPPALTTKLVQLDEPPF